MNWLLILCLSLMLCSPVSSLDGFVWKTPSMFAHKPLRIWTCIASWYGPKFVGKRTASGEMYNMNALTVAARRLPLGSLVRIINLRNKRSVVARVNDRGPWTKNRGLDVSLAVAQQLRFEKAGIARVRVEVLNY